MHIVHALSFPDISVHKLVLAPDAPAEIVIDANGLDGHRRRRSSASSTTTAARGTSAKLLDESGLEALRDILAPERADRGPDGDPVSSTRKRR